LLASRYRKGGESLGTFAADVKLHAQYGYPTFDARAREELALYAFLQGLSPEPLRQHVRLAMPQTLRAALVEAERAEVVLSTRPTPPKAPTSRPPIRQRRPAQRSGPRTKSYIQRDNRGFGRVMASQ
uniref:Uncharacterized protein n=1 Tax=Gouania willdenowi TaxID=441366 RepID=A0A8C5G7L1_GOUWI